MIRLEQIVKYYEGGLIKGLEDISCEIGRGEIVALTGPSGSGKSTLLNIISTIDSPTSGRMWVGERTRDQLKPFDRFRTQTIGFIFQFHHLLPHLTNLENIELAMFRCLKSKAARQSKASGLLQSVGLQNKKNTFPNKLSGGERQRVAVARALANDPEILLADEPTGSVDQRTGNAIMDLLISHNRRFETTIIVATHNPEIACRADRNIQLNDGSIV
jgi:putative ABC transport system ATP-binding protein